VNDIKNGKASRIMNKVTTNKYL